MICLIVVIIIAIIVIIILSAIGKTPNLSVDTIKWDQDLWVIIYFSSKLMRLSDIEYSFMLLYAFFL